MGQLSRSLAVRDVGTCYAVLVVVAAILALLTSRSSAPDIPAEPVRR